MPESEGKKKSLFGKKKEAAGEPVPAKAEKQPKKQKKEKPPRKKAKKEKPPKAPRAAKAKAKKGKKKEKKPLFGKKRATAGEAGGKPPAKKVKKAKRGGSIGGTKISPVGLDIGRTSITAARLKHQTGGSVLLQAALDNLPEGLISEGEVRDVEALAFALRDFWKKHKIKGRKVALGLANQKVVVRALDFPMLDDKELLSAIEFQAQDYIPIPAEEAVFAHHVMGTAVDEDGIEMQKVLVVAAQKDMVMDFVNAVKKAKLMIDGIDLQAFAMMRSMRSGSFLDEQRSSEAIAIANIASDITNIVVDVGGDPQFTRIISFGGDDFTKAVAEHQGIKFEEAEVLKIKAGLSEPGAEHLAAPAPEEPADDSVPFIEDMGPEDLPFRPSGEDMEHFEAGGTGEEPAAPGAGHGGGFGPPDERMMAPGGENEPAMSEEERITQVQRVLEVTTETLADELRRSFDYYMSQESAVPISVLLLSGGGALMPNLEKHLSQMFPFEVRMGDPTRSIVDNKSVFTDEELMALGPRLAIAIGLSMEDEGP